MDRACAPVPAALNAYHSTAQIPFTPPGHKQGTGADPRVRPVLADAVFCSGVLAVAGLDDRSSSGSVPPGPKS
jgi:arginine decarboxylase